MRQQAIALFRASFGTRPRAAASAPGRVNLIGEHTDYNGGPVLPVAIGARTTVAVGPGAPEVLEAVSTIDGRIVRVRWRDELPSGWAAYVAGVLRELWAHEVLPPDAGARVAIASDVPIGAGLSSSAALTVAAARALSLLAGQRVAPRQIAGIAYRAEHNHVGVRCGVMDQTIAALATAGHALLIECASLVTQAIPFRGRLLVVDTGVRHELAATPYNERVAECRAAPLVALDTETTSVDPLRATLVGMSLAVTPERSWYLPFGHLAPDGELVAGEPPRNLPPLSSPALAPLRALLADPQVRKAGHNVNYDWLVLRRHGVELAGVVYDSMLASFVLDPARRSHALADLARERLGVEMQTYAGLVGRGRGERPFAEVPVAVAARYCCADSEVVLRLRDAFQLELEDHQLLRLLDTIEVPLIPVLVGMEWHGVLVDREVLGQISRQFARELAELEQVLYRAAGTDFNINSTPQLRHILFEKLQLPVLKKTKTGASTDFEVLEQLAALGHEVPRLLIEYRELAKLKSTYVDALPGYVNPATGRIHTSFNQAGAATGRLSSSDPNLQNIPVRTPRGEAIRRAFVAAPGWLLLTADYSQIELRLLAHLSGDPAFLQAFAQGGDIHRQTAAIIFGVSQDQVTPDMRARAKTINFATIYGQGPFALSRQLGITQEEATEFIKQYFTRFQGVRAWLDRTVAGARDQGYVETLFGRRRYVPELKDKNFNIRAFGERTATNSPLQGSAADLIKLAMIGIDRALRERGLATRMLLQVHDELVFEVPEAEQEDATGVVKSHMETAAALRVPLVVSIGAGRNWVDAKG